MLKIKEGFDILCEAGGVKTLSEANKVFEKKLDNENLNKLSKITNEEALLKIANAIVLCEPDYVFIDTGSEDDVDKIRKWAIEWGEEEPLALSRHTVHFDLPQEQGRLVKQTFYVVNEGEKVSSLAQSISRRDAFNYVKEYMKGIMRGMVMMVGFFSRGPIGAKASVPAIQISSSAYVFHSAEILYRNCYECFDKEVSRKGIFFTNLHSQGSNKPEDIPKARIFMDRSWFTTFSTFCTYAGNTLLLKKGNHRFAVDYCVYYRSGEELSEHMFITGVKGPNGRITYFAGAAPSGCGKTTTAMAGDEFIGDDLAQLWIDDDGTLRAINPEKGIFGIVEDVNWEGDPHLMKVLRFEGAEVIWSNVLIDKSRKPYWTGCGEELPESGRNFQGLWWKGKLDENGKPIPPSHPNARVTLPCNAIDNYNAELAENPKGVPIKVITYSGRDSDTMPPVWVARTPDEGVVIGASIVSAATFTEVSVSGVRRQPWANEPFIPGPLGDYMRAHFLFFNSPRFSEKGRPIIAGLNYFLTHEARGGRGRGLLGEKKDVKVWLGWLELFAHKDVEGIETPIGYIPKYEDLKRLFMEKIQKDYPYELYEKQFSLYIDNILARIDLQWNAYSREENIPKKLFEIYGIQKRELIALKSKYGHIVKPHQLQEDIYSL